MPVAKIGIDFGAIGDLSPINVSIPRTVEGFVAELPRVSNELTYDYFGLIVLTIMCIILIIMLYEKNEYGLFRYSLIRAIGIAGGMCAVIGFLMINIGYFKDYYHVVVFFVINLICSIWVWMESL